ASFRSAPPELRRSCAPGSPSLAQIFQVSLGKYLVSDLLRGNTRYRQGGFVALFELVDEDLLHRHETLVDGRVFEEVRGLHQRPRKGEGLLLEQQEIVPPHPIGLPWIIH